LIVSATRSPSARSFAAASVRKRTRAAGGRCSTHGVGVVDRKTLRAPVLDELLIELDSPSVDSRLAEELEKLAPTRADVEHRRRVPECIDVDSLAFPDACSWAADPHLQREVVERWLGDVPLRNRCRDGALRAGRPPLEPVDALLELVEQAGEAVSKGRGLCKLLATLLLLLLLERAVQVT
jgi:hypothetical protein